MANTATAELEEQRFVLTSLPPSRAQKRLALAVVLALLVIFFIAAGPLSRLQPGRVVAFLPIYTTAIVLSETITAILLFTQFYILRTRALLIISSGYLFAALMPIPWILMFPGVFVTDELIGGIQSRAYIYFLWHAGFSVFVLLYALLKDADPSKRYWHGTVSTAIALSVALTVAVVSALAFFFAAGHSLLPRVELDALRFSSLWLYLAVPMSALIFLALLVLWIRRRSVLDLWLMVVMCAYQIEICLSYYPLAIVYGFGWYASRIFGLFSSTLVLLVLLHEITTLHVRLLRAVRAQRGEREARLATGGVVAATIAHEVRQPLSGMITNADAALNWLNRPVPDLGRARTTLEHLIADGRRAGAVIESVQAIFKRDAQNRAFLDVNGLIGEALAAASENLERHRISVQSASVGSLRPIYGDRIQLQQVLANLIANAIDAMASKDGRRVLRVQAEGDDAGGVLVSVADTGTGIVLSDIERIFDPLFTTKPDGMGMGLAICRSIIGAHGGRLTVRSSGPEGTVFQFVLHSDVATIERANSKSAKETTSSTPAESTP